MQETKKVLVIGGTGFLGSKVVKALLQQGSQVRALVRPRTDPSFIVAYGAEIVRGDLLDRTSLDAALLDIDAVVTSAAGYNKRRRTDTDQADTLGFENLAKAAKKAGVKRFVLTGVLKSNLAIKVPHFQNKQKQEDLLERLGVPFVSIRPGSFLNQSDDFLARNVSKGKFIWFGSEHVPMSWIRTEEVANYLALAVTAEGVEGQRIEVGLDRNLSPAQLKKIIEDITGQPLKLKILPWWLLSCALKLIGIIKKGALDFHENLAFFQTGKFTIKDRSLQIKAFGMPPKAEDSIRAWLIQSKVIQSNTLETEQQTEPYDSPNQTFN